MKAKRKKVYGKWKVKMKWSQEIKQKKCTNNESFTAINEVYQRKNEMSRGKSIKSIVDIAASMQFSNCRQIFFVSFIISWTIILIFGGFFFLEIALNRHHRFLNHVITNDSEYQMDCTKCWHIHYSCIEFWNLISVWWSTTRPFMNHGGKMWDFLDLFLSVFFFPLFFFIVFFLSYKPEWIPTNKFTIQSN